ncbi:DddA-like double-stranded DNA deaminase toxin [Amycolatopsis sp. cg5]|uniref:DddA-like double-stranded DNA deaminase toxin n=1 Tax=Amycolatopsis sp. cg5 TaxID=3238802 RepID=UPI0035241D0A
MTSPLADVIAQVRAALDALPPVRAWTGSCGRVAKRLDVTVGKSTQEDVRSALKLLRAAVDDLETAAVLAEEARVRANAWVGVADPQLAATDLNPARATSAGRGNDPMAKPGGGEQASIARGPRPGGDDHDDERNDWCLEDGRVLGQGDYWYPVEVADYVSKLPARKDLKTGNFPQGRKTTGYLVGKTVPITSGTGIGYPEAKEQLEAAGFEKGNANFLAMHVEMKLVLAVLRRDSRPSHIDIVVNNRPCRINVNRPGCGAALERILAEAGMSVTVYGTDESGNPFKRTYPAKRQR